MSEPTIKVELPQEHLEALVKQWVLKQLDDEQRDAIISQAIDHLMRPTETYYSGRRQMESPLQTAFNTAIQSAVNKVAREMIDANAEVQKKLQQVMGEALQTFFQTSFDAPGSKFGQAMSEAFASWWCDRA